MLTFTEALYNLLFGPLELIFDVVYALAYWLTENPGVSIVFLSLAINLMILPLYRRADQIQENERKRILKIQPGIDHIKKVFKGDERFMMLQTYYRQNHYKPYYALGGSISLLLEVPFFIAAYNFLSNQRLLNQAPFGPIADLSCPDGLLTIGGFSINVLPLVMTGLNIISGMIYTKGMPIKNKLQLYGMAAVFLVLLYNSPSGLVLYWTLNNLFSLIKNVFYKLSNPILIATILSSLAGIGILGALLILKPQAYITEPGKAIIFLVLIFVLQLPFVLYVVNIMSKNNRFIQMVKSKIESAFQTRLNGRFIFYIFCIYMTILTGLLIPSAVINASPEEFAMVADFKSPLWYVLGSLLLAAGTFLIWFVVFYKLVSDRYKRYLCFFLMLISIVSTVDYMFFGNNYGQMSAMLRYNERMSFENSIYIINTLVLILVIVVFGLIWFIKKEFMLIVAISICLVMLSMSVYNIGSIQSWLEKDNINNSIENETPSILLSKNGKNVVVIMMDRAINAFVPFLFEEKPELLKQFDGFTYYPNTISYGSSTNTGTPGLYGGYDYTPVELNRRDSVLLKDKQNEALKIMPLNFLESGYEVTVCDPPYANYKWIPDLSIYDEYPEIHKYITQGMFLTEYEREIEQEEQLLLRNFFCYSIFRISPVVFHKGLYDYGRYNHAESALKGTGGVIVHDISRSEGIDESFMNAYSVLQNLGNITRICESEKGSFCMLSNVTTHEVASLLQEPEYIPAMIVDNSEYDRQHRLRKSIYGEEMEISDLSVMMHYHANMAAMIELGKWFDHLREENIFDNTRIIIVADHGNAMSINGMNEKIIGYNPLLMVKDFNSTGFIKSEDFMTNADTPSLAFLDIITKPVNPFSGNTISDKKKKEIYQSVISSDPDIIINNGTTFKDPIWYKVNTENIFDPLNWEKQDTEEEHKK